MDSIGNLGTGAPTDGGNPIKGLLRVEVERDGVIETLALDMSLEADALAAVRKTLGLDDDDLIFELDGDKPLVSPIIGRKVLQLVVHKARKINVQVRYEHRTESRDFGPAKTVFKVLQFAVGKKGFDLDPTVAAKANLILPGAETPLPREAAIGSFVKKGERALVLDLTLKDFTNG